MNELGPDARSILDAARTRERPTDADRARVRRSLMRAVAAGGAAAAATAAGTGAAAKGTGAAAATTVLGSGAASVASKVVAVLVIAGAVSAGVSSAVTKQETPVDARPSAAAAPVNVSTPRAATPAPAKPPEATPEPSSAPESSPPIEPPPAPATPAVSRAQPRASAAPAPATEDPLDVETRGLGEAHRALQSGDAERALSLLDKQSAAHAQGELREERAAARVFALCEAGKTGEAKTAAEAFLRESPRSPLAGRVRGACAGKADSAGD